MLPLAPLFLFLGETGGRGPGGLVPPLPLCVVLGEDGPDSLFAQGEVGGDVEERGTFWSNSQTKSRQVVPKRKAWTISESPTLGNSVHYLEKHRMKSRRDSSGF